MNSPSWWTAPLPTRFHPRDGKSWFTWCPRDSITWYRHACWRTIYPMLVYELAPHVLGPDVPYYFQAEPNLRVQLPGETAVPWHTDAEFGHQPAEWNVWVPMTYMSSDSQRIWLEPVTGARIAPDVNLGEYLVFPGARMRHGNQVNTSKVPRYSFDFRLIPRADYRETGAKTVLYGMAMTLGEYWR